MKLNEGEKIDSWDVVVKTTEGRELSFSDLSLEINNRTVLQVIDDTLEATYPVTWNDEN